MVASARKLAARCPLDDNDSNNDNHENVENLKNQNVENKKTHSVITLRVLLLDQSCSPCEGGWPPLSRLEWVCEAKGACRGLFFSRCRAGAIYSGSSMVPPRVRSHVQCLVGASWEEPKRRDQFGQAALSGEGLATDTLPGSWRQHFLGDQVITPSTMSSFVRSPSANLFVNSLLPTGKDSSMS